MPIPPQDERISTDAPSFSRRPEPCNQAEHMQPATYVPDQPSRENARTLLHRRIQKLKDEISRMESLSKAMPVQLPPLADEFLWEMLLTKRI